MADSRLRIKVDLDASEALRTMAEMDAALRSIQSKVAPTRAQELEQAIEWALNHVLYAAPEVFNEKAIEAFSHLRRVQQKERANVR